MTETVTLALQGRAVQLGISEWGSPIFAAFPRLASGIPSREVWLTGPDSPVAIVLRRDDAEIAFNDSELADLRDILNALKEGEAQNPPGTLRLLPIRYCEDCCRYSSAAQRCRHPAVIVGPHADAYNDGHIIPDWCPLPKEPTP